MNDFPVNQAKDGFIWDDGLEDAFIDALKSNIQEYIDIAEMSIKERANETQYSEQASNDLQQDVADALNNAFSNESTGGENEATADDSIGDQDIASKGTTASDIQEYIDTVLHDETPEELVGTVRNYKVQISPVICIEFNVQWSIGTKTFWINYSETSANVYDVLINIDHPFFMPFSKDESFKRVLEKFALAFVLAESQAKLASDRQGYIPANFIKNYMNQYLKKLAEE